MKTCMILVILVGVCLTSGCSRTRSANAQEAMVREMKKQTAALEQQASHLNRIANALENDG